MTRRRPSVRITGGSLRGRPIEVPSGLSVRPMRSRVREALFAILGDRVPGCRFLDIFSGSGAIAIEALSRGARETVLIENHPRVLATLRRNLGNLALEKRCRVDEIDPYTTRIRDDAPFDVIFLDPPFSDFDHPRRDPWSLARESAAGDLLSGGGTVGLECPSRHAPPHPPPELTLEIQRRYGDTSLVLWRRR